MACHYCVPEEWNKSLHQTYFWSIIFVNKYYLCQRTMSPFLLVFSPKTVLFNSIVVFFTLLIYLWFTCIFLKHCFTSYNGWPENKILLYFPLIDYERDIKYFIIPREIKKHFNSFCRCDLKADILFLRAGYKVAMGNHDNCYIISRS